MAGILVAAALAAAYPAAAPAVAEAQPSAAPAMFVVRDADTTVYLFGTFHALDGKSAWFNDRVRNAFEQSDELVLETLVPEGRAPGAPRPKPLPSLSMTPSASFLASTRMAISAGQSHGMQVGNGADMVLRHVAEAEGKPVEGLETLESQLNMFTRMPATPAVAARRADAPAMATLSKSMVEMQEAWKQGDQAVFVRMLGELERGSPDTYRMMFTERNARWADWIRARMQTPGTVFVAVGAGHLAGTDRVLVRLAQLGIRSSRVY
jgi:uncharacterized protein YbaP (TraB family)